MFRLVLLQILSFFGSGLSVPAVSLGVQALGGSGVWIGLAFSGVSLMRAWSLSLTGYLLDRVARPKRFLLAGGMLYLMAALIMATAESVRAVVLGRFLQGFSMAFYLPATYVLAVHAGPSREETRRLSLLNVAFFVGFSSGPALGGWLIERLGWRAPFWGMVGVMIPGLALILWGFPGHRVGTSIRRSFWSTFRKVMRDACVLGLFLLRLGIAFGRGVVMAFLPVLGVQRGLSAAEVGGLLTLQLGVMTLLQYPMGVWIDRYGRPRLWIIAGNTLVILGLVGFIVAHRPEVFWGATVITGLGGGLAIPGALALMTARGKVLGLASTVSVLESAFAIGFAAGPVLGGILSDAVGMEGAFWAALGAGLLGLGAFILTTRAPLPAPAPPR